jgi:aryl-alcohol dehydrogenase-like predicted oxidoreductase
MKPGCPRRIGPDTIMAALRLRLRAIGEDVPDIGQFHVAYFSMSLATL